MHNENKKYDIAIIGCGPAGLSAAINVKIRNKTLIIFGGEFCTPKLYSSPKVDNYLGFKEIEGPELRELFLDHVQNMDISIYDSKINNILKNDDTFNLNTRDNKNFKAKSLILAVGVTSSDTLPGEEKLLGKGVSYCATCDGALYKGKEVAVLAYEKEAENEAKFLSEYCKKVYFIPQYKDVFEIIAKRDNIEIIYETPKSISGENRVDSLNLEQETLNVSGIFIVREEVPVDQLLPGLKFSNKFIEVDLNMQTNIPGVFAAGDCVGEPFQLAKAVGQGQVAALNAVQQFDK